MKLLKSKQQPAEAPVKGPSLAERIKQARLDADEYIDQQVAKLKATKDAECLPIGMLRQMLTKNSSCACRAALRLLEEKNG